MLIKVQGRLIETRSIWKISDSKHTHGFRIHTIDGNDCLIGESYRFTRGENADLDAKYAKLKEKVQAAWDEDKQEITVLEL